MKGEIHLRFFCYLVFVGVATGPRTLTVLGRDVTLRKTCGSIADCTFDELCGAVSVCIAYIKLSDTSADSFPLCFFCSCC